MRNKQLVWALALAMTAFAIDGSQAATSGVCKFDSATLKFRGTAEEGAKCLLRPVKIAGNLGSTLDELPSTLKTLVGTSADLPRAKVRAFLATLNVTEDQIGGRLDDDLSQNSAGQSARFFVIHDTSAPFLGNVAAFPADIDTSNQINKISQYAGPNSVAHLFINRRGDLLVGHPFTKGWRATRLETNFAGTRSRGLFIHVELVQPRRENPAGGNGNDQFAPDQGFTDIQYQRLALAYTVASVRRSEWLMPGFHAVLDSGISGGHDDPQRFDLTKFDAKIGEIIAAIGSM